MTNSGYRTLKLKKKQQTTWIILNRPNKLNAINASMLQELSETIDTLEQDPNVNCVVITGEGQKAFSSGADLTELQKLTPETVSEFSVNGQRVFSKLEKMSKPVVAAINGYALGGGLELALACDFRIAAENAEFGCPEIKLGFVPAWGGTQRLPLTVGLSNAKQLIMTGNKILAKEAYSMGLVDKVVSLQELETETQALAQRLCEQASSALKHAKCAINLVSKVSSEGLKKETEAFVMLFSAKETKKKIEKFGSQRNKK
ncbi:MAG: crotonase [Candidatus Bathyarchaeum sp.]|nr:MAG: crotonase [Candidatus Bathyarchaeum sp.]